MAAGLGTGNSDLQQRIRAMKVERMRLAPKIRCLNERP
jgi:hypothetical protein